MHLNSQLMFDKHAKPHFAPGMRVLEIGPDGHPSSYRQRLGEMPLEWETLDLFDDARLTYRAPSEYEFPIPDGRFDIVVSGQVIEHVRKIWVWMREVSRVCKPGGMVITINPASWPYHEAPIDCWRMYPEGMMSLYDDANLAVEVSQCESLEPGPRRRIPGRSVQYQPLKWRMASKVMSWLRLPVERSFDTVTIGRKRAA